MIEPDSRIAGRLRPVLHFTPLVGWMNDPHGIVFDGFQYHLFYQYVPTGTKWESNLSWGHAVSPDLVKWQEVATAISPLPGEVGCWSGSVVFDDQNIPTMFYTQPANDDWGRGAAVIARGSADLADWRRPADPVVIDGPPADTFVDFRDPQVRKAEDGSGWKLVMGAGIRDFGGCALQYSSPDLRNWTFDGVLASRAEAETTPIRTGKIWECPQFLQVDGQWVLIVSVQPDEGEANVAYAIGDYDGTQFTPRRWGKLSHTTTAYATSTFHDQYGRPCAISWLRERDGKAPLDSTWAGAQSVTSLLRVVDDQLLLEPHPGLQPYLIQRDDILLGRGSINFRAAGAWRLVVGMETGGRVQVQVAGEFPWALEFDSTTGVLAAKQSDFPLLEVTLNSGAGTLDIIVDADLIEVFHSTTEGTAVAHVPANESAELRISGANAVGQLRR